MKTASVTSMLACTSAALTVGLLGTPTAAADVETTTFGDDAELVDNGVVQAWVVSDLRRSADVIDYPVHGTLWEATATGVAVAGTVTPVVSNFNARAADGATYRVLFGAATPLGVNPATLAERQHTTGKLYFDVTGTAPETVVYNSMGTDRAAWVAPPPPATGGGQWSPPVGTQSTPSATAGVDGADVAEIPPLDAEGAGAEAGETVPTDALPTGSQGTPVEATPAATGGSQGTPVAEGSQGTPVEPSAAPVSPAPDAAAAAGTPQPETAPAGSQGTPATAAPTTTVIAPPPS
ncbi:MULTISPECIES: MPT63 family protein [Mycolicibacterium]|uniref:MPT63 family protein n=3 Tax=Mycolicibacterium TaxID=1866885 RepID=A0ABT6GYR5_MYCGU|nr:MULTISPECIES: MPT63 family protein [Mycolicibacterium]MCV7024382.1 MPT63 family protein [Mycolicibacterium novocastrense]MDG5486558.1 MPT63 family protein [Mycolicibacterium gadium]